MKLIASGVTNWAAITRSPSFSRSSSSTTTTIFPAAMSSRASSIVANSMSVRVGNELLHVLGDHVDLEIDRRAVRRASERRALERLRDQRDVEAAVVDAGDGQRHAVDGDRALLDDVAQQLRPCVDRHDAGETVLARPAH